MQEIGRGEQTDDRMVADGPTEPLDEIATPETVQPLGHRRRGHQDGSVQLRGQLVGATAYLVDPACADGQAVPATRPPPDQRLDRGGRLARLGALKNGSQSG